jgi:hypothetical protein
LVLVPSGVIPIRKRVCFWSLLYVCPEPVLAK